MWPCEKAFMAHKIKAKHFLSDFNTPAQANQWLHSSKWLYYWNPTDAVCASPLGFALFSVVIFIYFNEYSMLEGLMTYCDSDTI